MEFFFLHLALLALAFVLHAAFLKRYLASEMRIFLFQVGLFLALPLCSAALYLGWSGHITTLDILLAYGMSAAYSLSFLELWSLTEGSYSLQLLNAIASGEPQKAQELGSAVGLQKQVNRLQGIVRLGLVKKSENTLTITPIGWCVATATALIVRASGARLRE